MPERIHFLHVGKTGGTALKEALTQFPSMFEVELHQHDFTLAQVPAGEQYFFFLRHPVSRFVSGFNSRLRKGRPRYGVEWSVGEAEAFGRFPTPDALALALFSASSGERQAAWDAMAAIQHVRNSVFDWFGDEVAFEARLDDLLFVGSQPCLNSDFRHLKSILKLPADAALPDDAVVTHRSLPSQANELSERAVGNLRSWYARDVAFYEMAMLLRAKMLECETFA